MDPVNYDEHFLARLGDFFGARTLWQRRLWSLGSVLALREVAEAAGAVQESVLSEAAFRDLVEEVLRQTSQDPACRPILPTLKACMTGAIADGSYRKHVVLQAVASLNPTYLSDWAGTLEREEKPGPERAARAVAAHLLDHGIHPEALMQWLNTASPTDSTPKAAALVSKAIELLATPERGFTILVPIRTLPRGTARPDRWQSPARVAQELRHWGIAPRQCGGFYLEVQARDSWSAEEKAFDEVERLCTRVALGGNGDLVPLEQALLVDKGPFLLRRGARGVEVGALARTGRLYSSCTTVASERLGRIDAALGLLGPLNRGAPASAVAGAWSAVETLLAGPGEGDKVAAAEKLALLVACSFPRAELTRLAHVHAPPTPDHLSSIPAETPNHVRATIALQMLRRGETISVRHRSDKAALQRVLKLLRAPQQALLDIQRHAGTAIRRLYRQRNLVLHGGRIDNAALNASLRTAAPLVGAGIDRIVHAWLVNGHPPSQLAALARVQLDTLGSLHDSLCDLLEKPGECPCRTRSP